MSSPDWSWEDVELLSTFCKRIAGYSDGLEPHLQGLLDKYRDLGWKLGHLSSLLKISSTRYYDSGLENHLQTTVQQLQAQHNTHNVPSAGFMAWFCNLRRNLRRNKELTMGKIKQLHFVVDKHINTAERFRTDLLFNYASPKLEFIFKKFVNQVPRQSRQTTTTETSSANANRPDVNFSNIPTSSSTSLPIAERGANTPVKAPFVISIARMLWQTRATMLDYDQARRRQEYSSRASPAITPKDTETLAKEKYLANVLSLMEETPLDELCAPTGRPSREFLDRLAAIMAQATQLVELGSLPDPDAYHSNARPSTPPNLNGINNEDSNQLPTPPHSVDSSDSPESIGRAYSIPENPLPPLLSPPISGATTSTDRTPEARGAGGSWVVVGNSGPSEFRTLGPPAISSSVPGFFPGASIERIISSAIPSAMVLGEQAARTNTIPIAQASISSSWTQISCQQVELMPSLCTLRLASSDGKHYLLAVVTANPSPAMMAGGITENPLVNSPSTNHTDRTRRSSSLSNERTYEHLIPLNARAMASVLHPDYEGPAQNPGRPYTLSFKEPQSLCEYTYDPRPQLVSDLEYIFSSKTERDRIRSDLFGKQLRLHAGVETIELNYVACLKGAISLWEESASKPLTISFERKATKLNGRKSKKSKERPDGEVEYELVHLQSRGEALKDPLRLTVRQVAGPGSRNVASEEKECRLYFTRNEEKAAFISILEPPQT